MPEMIDCPSCGRKLRQATGVAGQLVKCPGCGTTFAATPRDTDEAMPSGAPETRAEPEPGTAAGELRLSLEEDDVLPRTIKGLPPPPRPLRAVLVDAAGDRSSRPPTPVAPCPACGEPIRQGADYCNACGTDLGENRPGRAPFPLRRFDREPERGSLILTLGVSALLASTTCVLSPIGLVLGIIAWVMGQTDLRKIREDRMEPEGLANTRNGRACGIVATALPCLFFLVWLLSWLPAHLR